MCIYIYIYIRRPPWGPKAVMVFFGCCFVDFVLSMVLVLSLFSSDVHGFYFRPSSPVSFSCLLGAPRRQKTDSGGGSLDFLRA